MLTATEQPMSYVKIKTKGQVTIPAEFRRDLNLKEGDFLEVVAEEGSIVLKPKAMVDRYDEAWAKSILGEAQEEAKRYPKTQEDEEAEERMLLELGERQAKKLGIQARDAEKIVNDYRKTHLKKT